MKNKIFSLDVALLLAGLMLGGCTAPVVVAGSASMIVVSKPGAGPDADTAHQIPPHEDWCYSTMGEPQCFAHVQDVPPDRLINVEPQNHYPVDLASYRQALDKDAAVFVVPAPPTPLAPLTPMPAVAKPAAPALVPVVAKPVDVPPVLMPAVAVPVGPDEVKDDPADALKTP